MKNWFTADSHLGHGKIIQYCNRPFGSTEEMNETIIANWNACIKPEDHVYHLGDVGIGSPEYLHRVLRRLKGKIHLIKGNHDKNLLKDPACKRFVWIKDVHFLTIQEAGKKYEIFLSHYAHRSWPKSHRGVYHLFGHSHSKLPPFGLSFDVGVDCWNFFPIDIKQIEAKMADLKVVFDKQIRSKEESENSREDLIENED